MIRSKRRIFLILVVVLLLQPSFALAEGDYEQGDGWSYQDGTLTVIENNGLKDFISNDQDEETGEWKYQHSDSDIETLVIGKNVTELINEIFEWNQLAPRKTIIESGNACFVIENGWVINTRTKTLYGAANAPEKRLLSSINDLSDDIVHIGDGAFFDYRNMTSILLPQSIESIGNRSFMLCQSLASVPFPNGLQIVGDQAFEDCEQLSQIYLCDEIRTVGFSAFSGCTNIEHFYIRKARLTKISSDLFGACYRLQIIELPETVEKIEHLAFRVCYAMHTLIVNSSDIAIDDTAFSSCDNLRQIIFTKGTPASFGDLLFGEKGRMPDRRYYISDSSDHRGMPIPYPTLFYTAAYADEWAPNGETEWNGYPIEEISLDELNAILAEARGEPAPTPIATAASTATAEVTISVAQTEQTNTADTPLVGVLVAGLIVLIVVAVVVVGALRRRKEISK